MIEIKTVDIVSSVIVIAILLFDSIRDILRYRKGKYNPYLFRKVVQNTDPFALRLVINMGLIFSIANIKFKPLEEIIFNIFFITIITVLTILNFLMYRKIKELKILLQTLIFDVFTVLFIFIFNLYIF